MLGNFFLANHIPVGIATVKYFTYVLMQSSHVIAKLQNNLITWVLLFNIIVFTSIGHKSPRYNYLLE